MSIEAAFFGALGRDAEAKTSKAGKSYLRLNIRVGDGDGVQWVSAMVFDPTAIEVVDKLIKGARVYVEGSLSVSEWTDQAGGKRHGLSVMSWHCRLSQIGRNRPKRESDKPAPAASGRERGERGDYAPPKGHPAFDDEIPF
jgi:single-stranded DNA-binding protein